MSHASEADKKYNRLAKEKSPYLLQHAENPVDWYPWGKDAFEKARNENKPIFLSIGYSTCHWCHVMEEESFEDPEVAELMNDAFVSIKVDREERPDIDNIYMGVCQMLTGSGGWPLTIVMTPDRKPFFAATYIPKNNRFGRTGMMDLVPRLKEIWMTRHEDVLKSADQITEALSQAKTEAVGEDLGPDTLKNAYTQLRQYYDPQYGGFGNAPKFPTPHNFTFLLRNWNRTREKNALQMVEDTLQAMRLGGVYDHVGFGFHRYSTDRVWLLPHFEKMLYDQALLTMAYTETYLATRKKVYEKTAREILTYVLRDMTSPEGGFYSAEDADSEGEEGKFYVWTQDEIRRLLPEKEADLIIRMYNMRERGNFTDQATGESPESNILHLGAPLDPDEELQVNAVLRKLFEHREKRVHPLKDTKILTDWNGLMIAALAKASQAFDEPMYAGAAKAAADFLLSKMRRPDGRLLHRYRDGDAALSAHIDDYAFLIWGLIELYEATFDVRYLKEAFDLNRDAIRHFWDEKSGGFYFTASDAENLLVRQKEVYDGAVPSGNSVAMLNLLRLSRISGDASLEEKAAQIGRAFSQHVQQASSGFTQLLAAVDFALGPSYEVVISGNPSSDDTQAMLRALRSEYTPNKVVLLRPNEEVPAIAGIAPFTKTQSPANGKATAYVCLNYVCKAPTNDPAQMLELLRSK